MRSTFSCRGGHRATVLLFSLAALLGPAAVEGGQATDWFTRGDANRDGAIDIADSIAVLSYLFGGGGGMLECLDAADANDDGAIDIADPIAVLAYLFTAPIPLPAPFAAPGSDPTADLLGCSVFDCWSPAEVDDLIGFAIGTYPVGIPASTQSIGGGVTVEIQASDGTLTVASIEYDLATASITATGTAGADDVPFVAEWLIFSQSCTADLATEWTLTALMITAPQGPDAIHLIAVLPGSTQIALSNSTVSVSGCAVGSIFSVLSPFFIGFIEDQVQAAADDFAVDATAQIDALLLANPVYVCN